MHVPPPDVKVDWSEPVIEPPMVPEPPVPDVMSRTMRAPMTGEEDTIKVMF